MKTLLLIAFLSVPSFAQQALSVWSDITTDGVPTSKKVVFRLPNGYTRVDFMAPGKPFKFLSSRVYNTTGYELFDHRNYLHYEVEMPTVAVSPLAAEHSLTCAGQTSESKEITVGKYKAYSTGVIPTSSGSVVFWRSPELYCIDLGSTLIKDGHKIVSTVTKIKLSSPPELETQFVRRGYAATSLENFLGLNPHETLH